MAILIPLSGRRGRLSRWIYDPGLTEFNLFDVAPYPIPPTARVPEPAYALAGLGLAPVAGRRRAAL